MAKSARSLITRVIVAGIMLSLAQSAVAEDRRVRVINETSVTMVRLYGSNVGTDDWEEDILGSDVLEPYSSMMVNFDDGTGYCMFDLKAVFSDGDVVIRRRLNVCETSSWRVSE